MVIYFTISLVRVGGYQRKERTQCVGPKGAYTYHTYLLCCSADGEKNSSHLFHPSPDQ